MLTGPEACSPAIAKVVGSKPILCISTMVPLIAEGSPIPCVDILLMKSDIVFLIKEMISFVKRRLPSVIKHTIVFWTNRTILFLIKSITS